MKTFVVFICVLFASTLLAQDVLAQDPLSRIANSLETANRDRQVSEYYSTNSQPGIPPLLMAQINQRLTEANLAVSQANAQVLQLKNTNLQLTNRIKVLEKKGNQGNKDKLWDLAIGTIEKLKNPADVEQVLNEWLEVVCRPAGAKAKVVILK